MRIQRPIVAAMTRTAPRHTATFRIHRVFALHDVSLAIWKVIDALEIAAKVTRWRRNRVPRLEIITPWVPGSPIGHCARMWRWCRCWSLCWRRSGRWCRLWRRLLYWLLHRLLLLHWRLCRCRLWRRARCRCRHCCWCRSLRRPRRWCRCLDTIDLVIRWRSLACISG